MFFLTADVDLSCCTQGHVQLSVKKQRLNGVNKAIVDCHIVAVVKCFPTERERGRKGEREREVRGERERERERDR